VFVLDIVIEDLVKYRTLRENLTTTNIRYLIRRTILEKESMGL
jgi:hypothetical protein